MQYAPEFHTALIAVSSTFMAIAGIIVAIVLSRPDAFERRNRVLIQLELGSIIPGVISMILALTWFSVALDRYTITAAIALICQFFLMYFPLWGLIRDLDR